MVVSEGGREAVDWWESVDEVDVLGKEKEERREG